MIASESTLQSFRDSHISFSGMYFPQQSSLYRAKLLICLAALLTAGLAPASGSAKETPENSRSVPQTQAAENLNTLPCVELIRLLHDGETYRDRRAATSALISKDSWNEDEKGLLTDAFANGTEEQRWRCLEVCIALAPELRIEFSLKFLRAEKRVSVSDIKILKEGVAKFLHQQKDSFFETAQADLFFAFVSQPQQDFKSYEVEVSRELSAADTPDEIVAVHEKLTNHLSRRDEFLNILDAVNKSGIYRIPEDPLPYTAEPLHVAIKSYGFYSLNGIEPQLTHRRQFMQAVLAYAESKQGHTTSSRQEFDQDAISLAWATSLDLSNLMTHQESEQLKFADLAHQTLSDIHNELLSALIKNDTEKLREIGGQTVIFTVLARSNHLEILDKWPAQPVIALLSKDFETSFASGNYKACLRICDLLVTSNTYLQTGTDSEFVNPLLSKGRELAISPDPSASAAFLNYNSALASAGNLLRQRIGIEDSRFPREQLHKLLDLSLQEIAQPSSLEPFNLKSPAIAVSSP